ncbi:hypothetical protein [Porcipelethomonas sp.]|uniref:hypothetical protein n=1 Tax=Porcipelethomonas sp. TaxID=2981675 RepID=UPI003EF0BBC7
MVKYLDKDGLTALWGKMKEKFALKDHAHTVSLESLGFVEMTTQEEWDTITYSEYPMRKFLITIKRVDNSFGCFIGINNGSMCGVCNIGDVAYAIEVGNTSGGFVLQNAVRISDETVQKTAFANKPIVKVVLLPEIF